MDMISFRRFLKNLESVAEDIKKNKSWSMHLSIIDESLESCKWFKEIPFIKFPSDFQIQLTQARGALLRFRVRREDTPKDLSVSVYFDAYGTLGACYDPYWEIYPIPYDDGSDSVDVERCLMNDTDELINAIKKSLDYLAKKE